MTVNQTNYHQVVDGGMARDLIQSQGLPLNKASISLRNRSACLYSMKAVNEKYPTHKETIVEIGRGGCGEWV